MPRNLPRPRRMLRFIRAFIRCCTHRDTAPGEPLLRPPRLPACWSCVMAISSQSIRLRLLLPSSAMGWVPCPGRSTSVNRCSVRREHVLLPLGGAHPGQRSRRSGPAGRGGRRSTGRSGSWRPDAAPRRGCRGRGWPRCPDRPGHVQPGPLGVGGRPAVPAAQPHRPGQLGHQELPLGVPWRPGRGRCRPRPPPARLPARSAGPGRRPWRWRPTAPPHPPDPGAPAAHQPRPDPLTPPPRRWLAVGRLQLDHMELPPWMGQQPGQVAQPLGIPSRTTAPS